MENETSGAYTFSILVIEASWFSWIALGGEAVTRLAIGSSKDSEKNKRTIGQLKE